MTKTISLFVMLHFVLLSSISLAVSKPDTSKPVLDVQTKPASAAPNQPLNLSRGQLLYENHCMVCHTSVVHVREKRQADSTNELYSWVLRWVIERKLEWQRAEIEAVVDYLNKRYYKFASKK